MIPFSIPFDLLLALAPDLARDLYVCLLHSLLINYMNVYLLNIYTKSYTSTCLTEFDSPLKCLSIIHK